MAIGGSGTQADPWTIGSSADLVAFAGSWSYWASGTYAKLTADIDMTGVSSDTIGNGDIRYQGNFDGNGHVISNLTISGGGYFSYVGLFGNVMDGTIQNIGCEGFNITSTESAGGLVGEASSATISNCYMYDCTVSGIVYGGGLVSNDMFSNISNCYTYDCTVSGKRCGGLVGYSNYSTISNCAVYGGSHGGTLVGYGSPTTTNCYTSNDVSSATFHSESFWHGGSYLNWNFTNTWYWDTTDTLPKLQVPSPVIAPAIRTKVSGSWVDVDKTLVKVNGSWKEVSKVFVKVSGSWKEV